MRTGNRAMQTERLTKRRDFLRIRDRGRKFAAPGLVLQVLERDPPEGPARIGFTVTRKIGGAVVRNRVKRRLRAAAAQVMPASAAAGYDYVLIGRKATLGRDFKALVNDLETALKGLGIFMAEEKSGTPCRQSREPT